MVPLNHLDRIFVGVNTLFLFKYPLYKNYKANVEQQLKEQNPELDVSELEELVNHHIDNFELTSFDQLTVKGYSEADIEEDNSSISYEQAYQEAHRLEEEKKREQMVFQ